MGRGSRPVQLYRGRTGKSMEGGGLCVYPYVSHVSMGWLRRVLSRGLGLGLGLGLRTRNRTDAQASKNRYWGPSSGGKRG